MKLKMKFYQGNDMNKLQNINDVLLMGPGPSCVSENVYNALSKPTIGHLDSSFINIMDDIKILLQRLLNTQNELTIPISGTGSAGMETCFVNLVEKNDNVLILVNGVFGIRMTDVAQRLGANVDKLEFEWGTPVCVETVKNQLANNQYDLVAVVHAETSTGVLNPIEEIGELVSNSDALFLVDCVTSLGGISVKMDEWSIDALYSGTQKCLSVPPGLSPISFSQNAVAKLDNRKSKVPSWYLDVSMIANYWGGQTRIYHHTAPINMNYALYQSLFDISYEGHDAVFLRHSDAHKQLVDGLHSLGLNMLVEESARLPMLNAVIIPDGINDAEFRSNLLQKHNIEIGGGLGSLSDKIWRIGLMGHTAYPHNVEKVLKNISIELP